jgi:hypothetical protein
VKDSQFKALQHPVGSNRIASRGSQVSPGYRPDITVRRPDGDPGSLIFIIESEQKTDRKAFLGDLLKAEVYAEAQDASPELIIVMQSFANTTTQQIADHLRPYKAWLTAKKGGRLHLSGIHVLTDAEYQEAISAGAVLGSEAFKSRGFLI